ncbi:HD family phosphohydrolase [Fervidibacillus halotolerans]|uniref:HD family phosphohydrolase n=1 Tax=Fervidibacillus halotolerans TaxID=2980027 RepID=A0A9E8LYA1_9BACI|nr:HD family phosphohydrolase [Fervidibacillus halotolerans]WAA11495.1 HD family phosphohydrolase [Fervidibacillus halotolerans]
MKKRKKLSSMMNRWFNKTVSKWFLMIVTGIVLFFSMYGNVLPEQLDIKKFSIAQETIRAPFTIEDKEMTEKKRTEAINQVQPQYVLKPEYAQNRVDLITSIFDSTIEVLDEVNALKKENEESEEPFKEPSTSEKVKMLKEKLTDEVINDLSESTLEALVTSSKNNLEIARDAAVTAVNNVMTERISASQVENAKKQAEEEIRYISLPSDLKEATIELGRYAVIQNEFYSPEATEQLREQAGENIQPVTILQGQIIVEEGQLITNEVYRQLELLGLVDAKQTIYPSIGIAMIVILLLGVVFYHRGKNDKGDIKELFIFNFILIISILLMKGISFLSSTQVDLAYLYPAAMSTLLLKILINDRLAIISLIVSAISGTIIFNGQTSGSFHLSVGIYILISGMAGIIFLTNQNQRSKIFQAGLFVSLVNVFIIGAVLFVLNSQMSYMQYLFYALTGIGSGVGSAVLSIGLLPFFEAGFGILSTVKLIELSNPNHPLLKKILTEAPGTYHHSVMVANLADAACEAIGANGLLARVGSYYHDIGKTRRPNFFIENQVNIDNPHDRISPDVSKDIIVAHTTDGAKILEKHHMPKEIIDIALQHHGTSLLQFFYHKAKEMGKEVREEDYRYPGPKPQTKEAAVISIADSVEAAVRSMKNPSMDEIENLVKKIIKDRINDNQFDECDITMRELQTVEKTLCESLHGIFHNRIKYPELDEGEKE